MYLMNHDYFLIEYMLEELFGLGGAGLLIWWVKRHFARKAARKKAMKDRIVELERDNEALKFANVELRAENTALKNK